MVIGTRGTVVPFVEAGLTVLGTDRRAEVDAVFVGWSRDFTMDDLETACHAVWGGARLFTASVNAFFATADGRSIGTSRAISAMITSVTGKRPGVLGKPSREALSSAERLIGVPADGIVVVGDDPGLEIAMARRGRCTFRPRYHGHRRTRGAVYPTRIPGAPISWLRTWARCGAFIEVPTRPQPQSMEPNYKPHRPCRRSGQGPLYEARYRREIRRAGGHYTPQPQARQSVKDIRREVRGGAGGNSWMPPVGGPGTLERSIRSPQSRRHNRHDWSCEGRRTSRSAAADLTSDPAAGHLRRHRLKCSGQ